MFLRRLKSCCNPYLHIIINPCLNFPGQVLESALILILINLLVSSAGTEERCGQVQRVSADHDASAGLSHGAQGADGSRARLQHHP